MPLLEDLQNSRAGLFLHISPEKVQGFPSPHATHSHAYARCPSSSLNIVVITNLNIKQINISPPDCKWGLTAAGWCRTSRGHGTSAAHQAGVPGGQHTQQPLKQQEGHQPAALGASRRARHAVAPVLATVVMCSGVRAQPHDHRRLQHRHNRTSNTNTTSKCCPTYRNARRCTTCHTCLSTHCCQCTCIDVHDRLSSPQFS